MSGKPGERERDRETGADTCIQYVEAKVGDVEKVMVDLGTGYFVEVHKDVATDYLQRRIDEVATNMTSVEDGVKQNSGVLEKTTVEIQRRLQAGGQ